MILVVKLLDKSVAGELLTEIYQLFISNLDIFEVDLLYPFEDPHKFGDILDGIYFD